MVRHGFLYERVANNDQCKTGSLSSESSFSIEFEQKGPILMSNFEPMLSMTKRLLPFLLCLLFTLLTGSVRAQDKEADKPSEKATVEAPADKEADKEAAKEADEKDGEEEPADEPEADKDGEENVDDDLLETVDSFREREAKIESVAELVAPAVIGMGSDKTGPIGSAVIISEDGLILTAGHVNQGTGDDIIVYLHDGRELRAEALGANFSRDASMARILEKGKYPFVELRKETPVELGEWVVAMGHTAGFQLDRPAPVRVGRVSEPLSRGMIKGYIKTDCTLAGGDSGGPLFDLDGKLVGIHSQIGFNLLENMHVPMQAYVDKWDAMEAGRREGQLGGPTAIPGLNAKKEKKPFLGVNIDREAEGVLVKAVVEDSAAADAGLEEGDIILSVDGEELAEYADLVAEIKERDIGDKMKLVVKRGDDEKTIKLKLGSRDVVVPDDEAAEEPDLRLFLEKKLGRARHPFDLEGGEVDKLLEEFRMAGGNLPADFDFKEWIAGGKTEANKENQQTLAVFEKLSGKARASTVQVVAGGNPMVLGCIVSPDGHILTKYYEVRKAKGDIKVRLPDGKLLPAEVVGQPIRDWDLVMLKVAAENLTPMPWTDAEAELGRFLAAPGASTDEEDASIRSLGVTAVLARPLSGETKGFFGVDVDNMRHGVRILRVVPDSPAENAGLRAGDVIQRVAGKKVTSSTQLLNTFSAIAPGTEVEIRYSRKTIPLRKKVALGSRAEVQKPHPFMDHTIRMGGRMSKQRGPYPRAIETDLPLEPDEIGGPLVDLDGRVLGLNIARAGRTRSYAIPSKEILAVLAEFPFDEAEEEAEESAE